MSKTNRYKSRTKSCESKIKSKKSNIKVAKSQKVEIAKSQKAKNQNSKGPSCDSLTFWNMIFFVFWLCGFDILTFCF